MRENPYETGFLDWLACASAGAQTSTVRRIPTDSAPPGRAFRAAVAGHVLDYDDTYAAGLVHLSACTAPAAAVIGAAVGASLRDALAAYAVGFEAMAAFAKASHPELYQRGWHPTAICGTFGAATAAGKLLELDPSALRSAQSLALLGAGGLLAAFGSDGKAFQVGLSVRTGVTSAIMASRGASAREEIPGAFQRVYGATLEYESSTKAVYSNWIKAYPCCLQTHSSIEAALAIREEADIDQGHGLVTVHPISRQAAPYDQVDSGLQAKFSIPYAVALALKDGSPTPSDFEAMDPTVNELAARIDVQEDAELGEPEARVIWRNNGMDIEKRVDFALGSPNRPMKSHHHLAKLRQLGAEELLTSLSAPEGDIDLLLERVGL